MIMFSPFSLREIPAQNILEFYITKKKREKKKRRSKLDEVCNSAWLKAPSTPSCNSHSVWSQDIHFSLSLRSLSCVLLFWRWFWHQMYVACGVGTNAFPDWCELYCFVFPCKSMSAGRALWKMKNFNQTYLLQIGNCVEMRGEIDYELAVAVTAASRPWFLRLPTSAAQNSHRCTCICSYDILSVGTL